MRPAGGQRPLSHGPRPGAGQPPDGGPDRLAPRSARAVRRLGRPSRSPGSTGCRTRAAGTGSAAAPSISRPAARSMPCSRRGSRWSRAQLSSRAPWWWMTCWLRSRLTGSEVSQLASAMTAFSSSAASQQQQVLVTTGIPATLQAVQASWRAVEIPVVLITAQLLAACLLLLFLSVGDAIDARGHEVSLAKLRGRGGWQTIMFGMSEPVLLLALALPAGVLARLGRDGGVQPGPAAPGYRGRAAAAGLGRGPLATGGRPAGRRARRPADPAAARGGGMAALRPQTGRTGLDSGRGPGDWGRRGPAGAGGQRADRVGPPRRPGPARPRAAGPGRRGHRLAAAAAGLPGGLQPGPAPGAVSACSSRSGMSPGARAGPGPRSCSRRRSR